MLAVDIAGSSDQQLQRIIAESCAPYGSIVRVKVHVSRINSPSRPCAIVDMANPEQAKRVADAFAATCIGKSVVILLVCKTPAANYSVTPHLAAPHSVALHSVTPQALPETRPKTMFQLLLQYESELRSR